MERFEPRKKVIIFTDADPPAGEDSSVSLNGYLAAVKVVRARKSEHVQNSAMTMLGLDGPNDIEVWVCNTFLKGGGGVIW